MYNIKSLKNLISDRNKDDAISYINKFMKFELIEGSSEYETVPLDGITIDRENNTILIPKKISDGNFKLPGHDTGFPTAADKWARMHRKANKRELQTLGIPTD